MEVGLSLFVRLWIMCTAVAAAAALVVVLVLQTVIIRAQVEQSRGEALSMTRLLAQALAVDPATGTRPLELGRALQERLDAMMATGRLIGAVALDQDLRRLAGAVAPGLESLDPVGQFGPELLRAIADGPPNELRLDPATAFVAVPLLDRAGGRIGVLAVSLPRQVLVQDQSAHLAVGLGALALAILLGLPAALALARRIARPINRLADLSHGLERGQIDTEALTPLIGRRDEIGRLARVVLRLVQALNHLGANMDAIVARRLNAPGLNEERAR
jgi:HAMP domain-containing protein